jgi:hypothetical protein
LTNFLTTNMEPQSSVNNDEAQGGGKPRLSPGLQQHISGPSIYDSPTRAAKETLSVLASSPEVSPVKPPPSEDNSPAIYDAIGATVLTDLSDAAAANDSKAFVKVPHVLVQLVQHGVATY